MLIVAVPAAEHVAAITLTVGVAGAASLASITNDDDAAEAHPLAVAVSV